MTSPFDRPSAQQLFARFVESGLRQRTSGVFTMELGGDVVAWLGMNTASHAGPPGSLVLNPVVGVRHQRVERVVSELSGTKFHQYVPPTISLPLRYLVEPDQRHDWEFSPDGTGDQLTVDRVAHGIDTAGMAYWHSRSEPEVLEEDLRQLVPHNQQASYRLPALLREQGHADRAREVAAQIADSLGTRDDDAAHELRKYLSRFESHV
jgi:hypothetical protein